MPRPVFWPGRCSSRLRCRAPAHGWRSVCIAASAPSRVTSGTVLTHAVAHASCLHPTQVAILGVKKTVGPPIFCAILWIFDIMFT